ncbi:Delta 8-(E)-sphingolipid desaturase [Fulvia fulva]|nr:Delta 8-(E)-sphingolipid desaturase [Fulvia fulva]KAK4614256.1 Delta 8-(E)-sphingolipid desaturase [Fulvia fulva]WPV20200.1 Delta 8-(E)-sphingolipid desaturase [Fulvia fulva]WPV35281.1 Delta 8-(E)-sphingolipid desaturase [Fulvia fulva]
MAAAQHTSRYRDTVLTRRKIESLIAEGRKIVIVNGTVLKVDAWLPYHPGGDKALLHMVGRDATNEVKAFHSVETQQFMQKYRIGKIEGQWKDFLPPIQGGVFRRVEEQDSSTTVESDGDTERDSSSHSSSSEPSPIFEPAERLSDSLRKRRSSVAASDSSATSLETLAIGEPAVGSNKVATGDERTKQERQRDLDTFPSLDPATQASIIEKYKLLDQRLRDDGLYNCNYTAYLFEAMRYSFLAFMAYFFLQKSWYALSGLFLGMMWHQLVFTVHDAGHMGITHNFHVDSCIGIFIADFLGGLSCCWWKRNHNVHHIVTNSAEHDPDIQHMPFFAVSHRFFDSLRSTYYDRIMTFDAVAKFVLQYQHYLYYPILTMGRFNLYVLSWQYIFLGQGPRKGPAWWHRYLEMAGQAFFWYWFGYLTVYKSIPIGWDRFIFVMVSHAITMPVHVQITLSHFAMSTADLGVAESFPQRMLRTTMDVDCPEWLDFFHGGLQFQAVHHLFPRMPRHNLRKAQKLVMEYCDEVGIPYAIWNFTEGNGKVIKQLEDIANQARIMRECQKTMTLQDALEGH